MFFLQVAGSTPNPQNSFANPPANNELNASVPVHVAADITAQQQHADAASKDDSSLDGEGGVHVGPASVAMEVTLPPELADGNILHRTHGVNGGSLKTYCSNKKRYARRREKFSAANAIVLANLLANFLAEGGE